MKRSNSIRGMLIIFAAADYPWHPARRDSTSNTNVFTSQQVAQVENSDAQDAVADKTEEDIDNQLEELENNNYVASQTKSFLPGKGIQ